MPEKRDDNAEFLAREALPYWIREVEQLENEIARLRDALEEIAENAVGKEVVRVAREATGETP